MRKVYLVREAVSERDARRLTAMQARQARQRQKKGQLSVLIEMEVLQKWREYTKERQQEEDGMTAAEIVEELLERELRRKKRW